MAQAEYANTTRYLDVVDIPPIINQGPRTRKDDDKAVPITDLSASAANGLGSENRANGVHGLLAENVVEKASAMPA